MLHLVMMLLATVRLLRAAPTQCVTLVPGYVWPEWRVVVSIIHRFLQDTTTTQQRGWSRLSFSSPPTNRGEEGSKKGRSTQTHHEFFLVRRCLYPR